jgi:hypothetical protein
MKKLFCILLASFVFYSCTPATAAASKIQVVTVYATWAAQPWLNKLYVCANKLSIVLSVNAEQPDIYLRVGEPVTLISPAYKIDHEELLVVTNREGPAQTLSLEEAQALFAGQADAAAQVWVYAADEDVQIAFDQLVMNGRGVTSFARLATSPQEMSDVLNSQPNAVGILPRHWKMGSLREVYSAGGVPVLALTKAEPGGAVQALLACLQK